MTFSSNTNSPASTSSVPAAPSLRASLPRGTALPGGPQHDGRCYCHAAPSTTAP
jgi:hypothetical protein